MSELRRLQQSFFSHLVGAPSKVVEHIQSTPDTSAQQRLDIYASGYRLRFKEAISTDYERLHGYLGDDLFERLMDCYIDRYQSRHPSLRYYSRHMAELLADQPPFSDAAELLEIAKIEQAFNHSFDAANCTPVDIGRLGQLTPEAWPAMRLQFHASVQLLPCSYNSFLIWKALSEGQAPPRLAQDAATWVIWRKDLVSRYRALSDAEAHALDMALKGSSFGDLCAGLLDYYDEQQTPRQAVTYLQTWISEMMVCRIS